MILLLCRSLRKEFDRESDYDESTGVLLRQRKLAEYVEMIYSAQAIHKSVLNLPYEMYQEDCDQVQFIRYLGGSKMIEILFSGQGS